VHLALTGDPTEMMVAWYTEDTTPNSTVSFGTQSGNYQLSVYGTYNWWKSGYGYNHFVLLTGLTPSTRYYYICGCEGNGWSNENSFEAAPSGSVPFTIGVYGDMGIDNSANTTARVLSHVQNGDLDFIYHVGDLAYADDHFFSFQDTWNTFAGNIEPISSTIPYMVLPGNHEYTSFDPFLFFDTKNFVVYNHRFMMPSPNSQAQSMYYSFDYSNVHFISYSTESSFDGAPFGDADDFGDEYAWLEEDLIQANLPENRKQRPWIIVAGHRPIYSSCQGYSADGIPINTEFDPPSNSATLQQVFEDLFYKYKVDLILNGHVHSYERNYPTYKNNRTSGYVNPTSPMNIVIGNAGNIEGLENGGEEDWTQPQPEWSAFRFGDDYGYAIMTVFNDTHLNWTLFRASDGGVEDEVTLINYNHY